MRMKRLFAAAAMTLMAIPAVAQENVTWWDFLAGGDGIRMKALIARFNEEHPDIKITSTTLEWGIPFYTKVRTAVAVGQGPDVMTYALSRLPLGLSEGVLGEITAEDLQNAGVTKEDFFPASVQASTSDDGKLYAVPFDIHSIALYYNKSFLEGSRFLGGDNKLTGISNLRDFEEALAYAKEKGAEAPVTYPTATAAGTYRVFYTLLRQQGGELISGKEVLAGDNLEKAAKAIEVMTNWRNNGWQPEQAESKAAVALFTSGKSAFMLGGVWEVPTMIDLEKKGSLGFQWGAVQVPNLMGTQTTWADSHAFAIPANNKMSPGKRKAVMTVIGWMEKNSLSWAEAGHIPAFKAVVDSENFKKMEPNATYSSLANSASYDPRSIIAGVASPVYDASVNVIAPAIHGYAEPMQAAEQVKQDLQDRLK